MNISPAANSIARGIEEMGNLLKNVTESSIGFQEKMLKVDAMEKASDEKLGQMLDVMA